ncbi:MAG: YdcF family protein [Coriobacteriales bacterium]|nr:YdcF family protein [Coriobacteriales bacterium]
MQRDSQTRPYPVRGVWRRFLILVPLLIVLVVASRVYIRQRVSTYEVYGYESYPKNTIGVADVVLQRQDVVKLITVDQTSRGTVHIVFGASGDGTTTATVGSGDSQEEWELRVVDGAILEGGVNFSGYESVHVSVCIFLGVLTVLFASVLVQLWRASWYGYTMVAAGGGLLFSLFQFAFFLMLLLRGSLRDFLDLAMEITSMSDWFAMASLLPMAVLALLVSASNLMLIRREGLRPVNMLGIAVSIVWAAANLIWMHMGTIVFDVFGSVQITLIVDTLVSAAITYGECLLLSTILCAWLASRHVPAHGADYAVVLGCGLRPDGTPCPLLAGRVNRALTFDEQRVAAGDAPVTFVPSGGQGPDEVISEAQSMGNYLQSKGVALERIVCEDKSQTTRENMAFSREVIERHAGRDISELRVVFSTTNYHVFRGYVCAHMAGMEVEGMGSKTRAYFWPNAFLREFAGLLVTQRQSILQVFVVLAVIYGIAAYILIFGS